jgi:choline dehydrogenase-like flavoprotein
MNASERFDAIVVGSGAGGAAAAYGLARRGLRVLLFEKGARLPDDGSTLDVERVVHAGAFLARETWQDGAGRTFRPEEHFNVGGKTRWYGAALLRYSSEEFRGDPAIGALPWPIGPHDLAPYYTEAERLLGVREFDAEPGLERIVEALGATSRHAAAGGPDAGWRVAPLPMALKPSITWRPHEARHFDGFASVERLKGDAETGFLARLERSPRLRLVTDAEVVALLPAADAPRRVVGVRLANGREHRARHVLLAAGALHSPRLLLRHVDAIGLRGALAPMAGRNLKLHHLTALVAVSPARQQDWLRKTRVLTHAAHPHSTVQPLGFDAELIGSLVPRLVPRPLARAIGERAYGFFLQTEDGSHPQNRVYEDGGRRVLDYDAARLTASNREHAGFTAAFRRALLRAGFASFVQRIGLAGTAHACGTLVAGHDPATSVVDAAGRVHGLDGLYVVDGSVLPRSGRVNPSLTIYAWALRVAALLAEREAAHAHAFERELALL